MPSAVEEAQAAVSIEKKEKSHKKSKGERKEKKRHRETEADEESGRKHKRSKSEAANAATDTYPTAQEPKIAQLSPDVVESQGLVTKKKKSKKDKTASILADAEEEPGASKKDKKDKKKKKKHAAVEDSDAPADEAKPKKEKKKKDKHRSAIEEQKDPDTADEVEAQLLGESEPHLPNTETASDAMEIDSPQNDTSSSARVFGKSPDKPYPFYTQTVSQYLPLYPVGMIDLVEGYVDQYLKPLLNRYIPTFRGVLLAYRNPRIGQEPGAASITAESEQSDEMLLESVDEYAVTFGWLTAEVDIFRPSRGAWMEGKVNLQSEGHLGVVCWGKFNAAVEASRLPAGWRWVDLESSAKPRSRTPGRESADAEAHLPTPEPFDEGEDGLAQLHTTGYWVDDQGRRVRDTIRFRIKNYEVGVSGDYGYLSIEGTMLDEGEEKAKVEEERELARRRKLRGGDRPGAYRPVKRVAEFSVTKFAKDTEEEDEAQRAEVWRSSRPGSEE